MRQVSQTLFAPVVALGGAQRRLRIPLGGGPLVVVDSNQIPTADALPAGNPATISPVLTNYLRDWYVGITATMPAGVTQTSATGGNNGVVLSRPNPPIPGQSSERPWEGNRITAEAFQNTGRTPTQPITFRLYNSLSASSGGANAFGLLGMDCYIDVFFESSDVTTGSAPFTIYAVGDPISPDR